jgi:hypothetical protein
MNAMLIDHGGPDAGVSIPIGKPKLDLGSFNGCIYASTVRESYPDTPRFFGVGQVIS